MRAGDDPRDVHWRKSAAVGQLVHARTRARNAPRRHAHARRRRPERAGDDWAAAFERRIRDIASRAVAHLKRGDRVAIVTDAGGRRGDRTLGADPLLRYLALARAVHQCPSATAQRRPLNEVRARSPHHDRRACCARRARGRQHGVAEPLDQHRALRRARRRARDPGELAKPAGYAHFATIAPLALLVVQGARLVAGRSPLDVAVEFAALLQIIRLATRRGAAHDQQIIVLALLHFIAGTVLGGGLTYGLCFLGFLVVAPGALVLSHLRREVEGNYRQGARDRTGLPVDVPRILRSRRVVGRGFLATTCFSPSPSCSSRRSLFILFPRIGLSLLLLNHPRAGRMVGFSDHVDLGDVGVLRDDPTIALRFEVKDLPDPPPTRLTLRLRGTAFDAYDGHAWARTQHDAFDPPTTGSTERHVSALPRARPAARSRRRPSTSSRSTHRSFSSRRTPSHCT